MTINIAYFRSTGANRVSLITDALDNGYNLNRSGLYEAYSKALNTIGSDNGTLTIALMICRLKDSTIGRIVEGAKDKEGAARRIIGFAQSAIKVNEYMNLPDLISIGELEGASNASNASNASEGDASGQPAQAAQAA